MKMRLTLGCLFLFLTSSVWGLIGEVPTIRRVAVLRSGASEVLYEAVAILTDNTVRLRAIDARNGSLVDNERVVTLPPGSVADITFSTMFRPSSILVLREDLTVLQYDVVFDSFGLPKLVGETPTILGPFNDPADVGAGTVLVDNHGSLGIGTAGGRVLIVSPRDSLVFNLGKGAVTGLTCIPQVGSFSFLAAHSGRVAVVDSSSAPFFLADPRPDPLIDLSFGAIFEPNDQPLTKPAPVSFVAANGTREIAILEIPADLATADTLNVKIVVVGGCPVAEVDRGSLFMRHADGSALLFDPTFMLDSGSSGRSLTVAGASLDLSPDTLNRKSQGQFVTAIIEVEGDHTPDIDPASLVMEVAGGTAAPELSPAIGDHDGDGQLDLLAKFDRARIRKLLAELPDGEISVTIRWRYIDDSLGVASTTLRIKK